MRVKGFIKETPYQLILILISFVFIVLIVTSIFEGSDLQNRMCSVAPWMCGSVEQAYHEVSKESTENAVCAIVSAFIGEEWKGSGELVCSYGNPSQGGEFGGAGASGGVGTIIAMGPDGPITIPETVTTDLESSNGFSITGAASSATDETKKDLSVLDASRLPTTVTCEKDKYGKLTSCTVKNFVMPQEVTNKEEWIPYWGDPQFLLYWNSFPEEEDSWRFEVDMTTHVIIGLLSILPISKIIGFGGKVLMGGIKNFAKKTFGRTLVKTVVKSETKQVGKKIENEMFSAAFLKGGGITTSKEYAAYKALKTGKELTDEMAETIRSTLSKSLSKSEFQTLMKEADGAVAGKLMKDVATKKLKTSLWAKLKGITSKLPSKKMIFGKFAIGEIGIHALAQSIIKKYEKQYNAIVMKSPGIKDADMNVFNLPDEMEGKPVLVQWNPTSGVTELKNFHMVSPCYLKEFTVEKKSVICGQYFYDEKTKKSGCSEVISSGEKAAIDCSRHVGFSGNSDEILKVTGSSTLTNALLALEKMNDKSMFEFYEPKLTKVTSENVKDFDKSKIDEINKKNEEEMKKDHQLEKIYLPWFMNEDKSGPLVYVYDIYYRSSTLYKPDHSAYTINGFDKVTKTSNDLMMGNTINELRTGKFGHDSKDKYNIKVGTSSGYSFFDVVINSDKILMEGGKKYTIKIYTPQREGGTVIDIYDQSQCEGEIIGVGNGFYEPDSCERIKSEIKSTHETTSKTDIISNTITSTTKNEQIDDIISLITDTNTEHENNVRHTNYVKLTAAGDITADDLHKLILIVDGKTSEFKYLKEVDECEEDINNNICFRTIEKNLDSKISCEATSDNKPMFNSELGGTYSDVCFINTPLFEKKNDYWIKFSRIFTFDKDRKIIDISYSELSFQPNKGEEKDFFVFFGDSDGNGKWDEISLVKPDKNLLNQILPDCIAGKSTSAFKIKSFGLEDNTIDSIAMENCNVDAAVVTFTGDRPSNVKFDMESGIPNYCLQEEEGFTRTLNSNFCGISIKNVLALGGAIFLDGAGVIAGAALEIGTDVVSEYKTMWPG